MAKKKNGIVRKYHPNYKRLYPEVESSEELMRALNESDRKIKYIEYDLKREKPEHDEAGQIINYIPPRERSIEQIGSSDWYAGAAQSSEELFLANEQIKELHRCILLLDEGEQSLIKAIYFEGLSDHAYARKVRTDALRKPRGV